MFANSNISSLFRLMWYSKPTPASANSHRRTSAADPRTYLFLYDNNVFSCWQVTLRRLSEALRSIDLQDLTQNSEMELGMGLEALDGSSVESINSSLEVRSSITMRCR